MNLAFGRCRDINGPLMEAALALYRSSFPAHELRLPPDQRDVMGNPLYHFDMCLLDGALAGLILYWDFGTYIYVEHFCVEPSLRGHGLGTLILAELARQNKGEKIACLEARRHYAWYLKGVPHAGFYKEQIVKITTLEDVYRVTKGIKRDLCGSDE